MSSGIYLAASLDGEVRIECWAATRTDMPAVIEIYRVEGSIPWDELTAIVAEHQAEHLCGPEAGEPGGE